MNLDWKRLFKWALQVSVMKTVTCAKGRKWLVPCLHTRWFVLPVCPKICCHSKQFSGLTYDEVNVKTLTEKWAHTRGRFSRRRRHYLSVLLSWLICIRKCREMWQHWHQMTGVCQQLSVCTWAAADVITPSQNTEKLTEIFSLMLFF